MKINFFNKTKYYRDPKKLAKKINSVLGSSLYNEFLQNNSIDELPYFIANIIEYYIFTNDKKTNYNFQQMADLIPNLNMDDFDYTYYSKNPILANASNGYNKKNIMENGFKNMNWDSKLEYKIKYCEDVLEKSNYLEYQNSKKTKENYMFFSFPGSLVIDYGMKISPERLYMGILKQDFDKILPYEVGEGKENYYKRVAKQKLEKLSSTDEKLGIYLNEIIHKLCTKDPIINLFLSESKNNKIEANVNYIGNGEKSLPIDMSYGSIREDGQVDFFNGGSYASNAANMVTSNLNIGKNEIGIVEIPDYFKCVDMKAYHLGYKEGDKINFLTMLREQENNDKLTEQEASEKSNSHDEKEFYENLREYVVSEVNAHDKNLLLNETGNIENSDESFKTR